jgi:hypothetical protein
MPKNESDSEATGFAPEAIPSPEETVTGLSINDVVVTTVPFSELGETLPTGVFYEGQRLHSYTLAPFTGQHELMLEELFNSKKQGVDKVYSTLRRFLPEVIVDIGGVPLRKLETDPQRLIDRMDLGDVFSVVLNLRCNYHGKTDIAISGQCPNCQTRNADQGDYAQPYHDLGTVDVKCYQNLSKEPLFDIPLEDGFRVTGDEIKKVRMRPLRFHQLRLMGDPNSGKFPNLNLISALMHSFPDSQHYREPKGDFFDRDLYGRLINSRRDKELVFDAVEKLQPGPIMQIDMDCIACSYKWKEGIPWGQLPSFLYGPISPLRS